jgi:hypothetical protein
MTLQTFKNFAETFSAIVISGVAIIGLNTWRKEIRGKTEFELAKKYLGTIYRIRKAIRSVRNPLITTGEMRESLLKRGSTEATIDADIEDHQKRNWAVYGVRWDKVVEQLKTLDDDLIEAEVVWGKEAVDLVKEFDAIVRRFRGELEIFLMGLAPRQMDENDIYDSGEGDAFSTKIEEAIKPVETFLKPYVSKKPRRTLKLIKERISHLWTILKSSK